MTFRSLKPFIGIIFFLITHPCLAAYQAPLFDNLGHFNYPISTKVPMAQRYFNQGIVLFYGFEWGEAARSFKEATRLDPNCAMCYWGLAFASLYKINAPDNQNDKVIVKTALNKAIALSKSGEAKERDIILALAKRNPDKAMIAKQSSGFSCHHHQQGDQQALSDFINALDQLTKKYPNDNEIKVWYALSVFWGKYVKSDATDPSIPIAINKLALILKSDPNNIGANHYYIHFIEATAHPGDALQSADRFNTLLVPGSEHLVHMPAHIYFLTGRYHLATLANTRATEVYQQYNKTCYKQGFAPEINFLYFHNYDFLRSSATVEGREALSLAAAKKIVSPPFAEWLKNSADLQWFIPIPFYIEARFARWNDILKEPMPDKKYSYALGMWHYVRGLAFIHQKKLPAAYEELLVLDNMINKTPKNNLLGDQGKSLLAIAREVLAANIDAQRGFNQSAELHLISAMKIQDAMGYHEPPDWYFPMREALGDFYLKIHQLPKAKQMFTEVLRQYPQHPWALYGLWQTLILLKDNEAEKTHQQFITTWKYADIKKPVSLF